MSKLELPYTRDCFVCGAHNPHGLHLRFRREGDEVHADFTPQPQHAGFRGIVHGGILSKHANNRENAPGARDCSLPSPSGTTDERGRSVRHWKRAAFRDTSLDAPRLADGT